MDQDMPGHRETVVTARLSLTPAELGDLDAMAALHGDERVWRHMPDGRHANVEQTRTYLAERERQWRCDGLGYWIARLREPISAMEKGEIAGIGGCAIPSNATWWNLYYRLTPEVHGHGLATELCAAAIDAAHRRRPDLPVVAFLVEHNRASKATAERAGLTLAGSGRDAGNPDPTAVRLIYSDRPLNESRLSALLQIT